MVCYISAIKHLASGKMVRYSLCHGPFGHDVYPLIRYRDRYIDYRSFRMLVLEAGQAIDSANNKILHNTRIRRSVGRRCLFYWNRGVKAKDPSLCWRAVNVINNRIPPSDWHWTGHTGVDPKTAWRYPRLAWNNTAADVTRRRIAANRSAALLRLARYKEQKARAAANKIKALGRLRAYKNKLVALAKLRGRSRVNPVVVV
jgi:hypothetical protein